MSDPKYIGPVRNSVFADDPVPHDHSFLDEWDEPEEPMGRNDAFEQAKENPDAMRMVGAMFMAMEKHRSERWPLHRCGTNCDVDLGLKIHAILNGEDW